MTGPDIRDLLDRVHRGELPPADAEALLADHCAPLPFEDLGFARVDHHRALRQGFPEVILGLGKTPAQIAAIAERIVARGQTLLVTRADAAAFDAVRAVVPAREYHDASASYHPAAERHTVRATAWSSSPPPARRTCRSRRRRP